MKRSLLVLINLLSFASPSFAVLDDLLIETKDFNESVKELRPKAPDPRLGDPRYEGRSAIYGSKYPKMVMIHPYNHFIHWTPFAAALPRAHAPKLLEDYCAQHLANYKKVYSFVVQPIQSDEANSALKPHYFTHPDAPTNYAGRNYATSLRWTVVPGAQGQIEPLEGSLQTRGLLPNSVHTHGNPEIPHSRMGVSADVMHLKGFNKIEKPIRAGIMDKCITSTDLYSLVAFTDDQGNNIVAITYHWLLNPGFLDQQQCDTIPFNEAIKKATTFRGLINGLEPVNSFKNMLGELKRYVGFPLKEVPLPVPQKPIVQKPVPQEQKKPIKAPQQSAVQKPVPQKQVSPSPNQKPALKQKSVLQENIKTTPVKIIRKAVPSVRKVIPILVPSVVQKPVAKPKAATLASTPRIAKATPVKTNKKATLPAKKTIPARVSFVAQKPVAKPKISAHRTVRAAPIKTNVKPAPVRVGAKTALTPTKAKVLVRKVVKPVPIRSKAKVVFLKGKANAALAKQAVLAPKKTFVHKAESKKAREQKRFKHGSKAPAANRK